ncbi:MAG: TM0106 family RecB-like putative nuclease, partial [Pseudomonadota bacterium]
MKKQNGQFIFSPTDLSGFINCKHLTQLNRLAAEGVITRPVRNNRVTEMLQIKGIEFENNFLQRLEAEGKSIVRIEQEDNGAFNKTIAAMKSGVDVVYQARLKQGNWQGWADFLIKVEKPSALGNWSYEVMDTKLASETKSGTILQIALYSQIIEEMQGLMPEIMHVQTPEAHHEYRVADFISFVRHTKKKFLESIEDATDTYPEPVNHCDVCNWWEVCNQKRRADDHLSFIAGMGNAQMKEVRAQGINTLEAMAELPLPIPFRPSKGAVPTYTKLREQARLQNESRMQNRPVYELLPLDDPEKGFFNLPEPTKWDVYLDLEGDPMVDPNGREYIVGWWHQDAYNIIWAEDAAAEKSAFENFVDQIQAIIAAHPHMRIYHFGAYEPSAFKRLMSKYATRENIIDDWLRNFRFIDLHSIVKHALRAGVERYSLKDLEKYHGFIREMDLRTLSGIKAEYEMLLETNRVAEATQDMKDAIALYNLDDCKSTEALHKWLEKLRQELIDSGEDIPRPVFEYQDPSDRVTDFELSIRPLIEALTNDVPPEKNDRTPEQQARFILANMLAYYRREDKSFWWEYFRITGLSDDELLEEKLAIVGLEFTQQRELINRSVIDTYRFPFQEYEIKKGIKVIDCFGKIHGVVIDFDKANNLIKIKKGPSRADLHPPVIIFKTLIPADEKETAIITLAAWVALNGMDSPSDEYRAARDLLL